MEFRFFLVFQLYNYFEDSNYVYLILEICHNGEMSRYIKNRKKPFSEDEGETFFFGSMEPSELMFWLAQ